MTNSRPHLGPTVMLVVLLLCACTAPSPSQPEPPPKPPVPAPEPAPPPEPGESEEFLRLVEAAERALAEDRLLTPERDSAYHYYQQALAVAPGHPFAVIGLERIVERYLRLAQVAIEREQWARARSMLGRAAIIDGEHTGIGSLRRQVNMLANAERLTLRLDRGALRNRSADIAAQLAQFGKHARVTNARVSIRAPSDADARWIYEQLSRSPGEQRIRGEVEIALPAQVTILLLHGTGN